MGILGAKLDVLKHQVSVIKPKTWIEVGCYRCDTMREMRDLGVPNVIGFDLFEQAPAHEAAPLDGPPITYEEASKEFEVYKGDTADTLEELKGREFEGPVIIFIDGGHSLKTTLRDIELCRAYQPDAILLMDDISMPGVAMALEASGLPWKVVGLETAKFTP